MRSAQPPYPRHHAADALPKELARLAAYSLAAAAGTIAAPLIGLLPHIL